MNASRNITLYIKTPFQSLFANASLYWRGIYKPPPFSEIRKVFYLRRHARLYQSGFNRLPALTPEGTPSVRLPFNPAQVQLKIFRLAPRNPREIFSADKAPYALKISFKKRAARPPI